MSYAEFSLIRFGTGLSPRFAGPDGPDALMQSLRDDSTAARYPLPGDAEVSRLLAASDRIKRGKGSDAAKDEARMLAKTEQDDAALTVGRNRLARALDDPTGFADRLLQFWTSHFNIRADSTPLRIQQAAFQENALRAHQRGRFADLLRAATLHPAMLVYLNQTSSVGPHSPMAQHQRAKRRLGLNENHARELLELHSMGVGSSYAQDDVRQLAKLMTGLFVNRDQEFTFDVKRVEPGAETVLGTRYGGAEPPQLAEIEAFLDDLAVRPETAAFITAKLARHFCADDPPAALLADMQASFRDGGGDLSAVYDVMVRHPQAQESFGQKVRQPQDLLVAGLRALGVTGAEVALWDAKQLHLGFNLPARQMGQTPDGALQPEGWPETAESWLSAQLLAARIDWAMSQPERLVTTMPNPRAFALASLPAQLAPDVARQVTRAESQADGVGLVLASPQFNRR